MSYIDAVHNSRRGLVQVVERDEHGNRQMVDYPADYVFYYSHPAGSSRSIYGDQCRKYVTNDKKKFDKELKRYLYDMDKHGRPKYKVFESDINPVFRCLADNYRDKDAPALNIGFFDIETGFCQKRGFAPPSDPFNPITAISIYLSHVQRCVALVLKPSTYTTDEAKAITEKFEDTFLFDSEAELLRTFLAIIDDVDVLTGWNCLPLTESVWLNDRIVQLGEVRGGQATAGNGSVIATNLSGTKPLNEITLYNGSRLLASDEHKIPVMSKPSGQYRNAASLRRSVVNMTVGEMKNKIKDGEQLFVEMQLRKNDNPDLTFRSLIIDNIETLWEDGFFDISFFEDRNLVNQWAEISPPRHSRYRSSPSDYKSMWSGRRNGATPQMITNHLRDRKIAYVRSTDNRYRALELDRAITRDECQLLGFIFTDGSVTPDRNATLYSTDVEMLFRYRDIAAKATLGNYSAVNLNRDKTGGSRCRITLSHLKLLLPAITASMKKKLHLGILSQLSKDQFLGFSSGLIDGDGWIGKNNIGLCNYDGSVPDLVNLFFWNGVYVTSNWKNRITIPHLNGDFLKGVSLLNGKRRARLDDIEPRKVSNTCSKKIAKFVFDDNAIVAVRSIKESDGVEMGDIMTETGYFISGGVKVHNSTLFDIPYIVNRVIRILDADTTRDLCLWSQKPRQRMIPRYGKEHESYDLVGRCHLDYLELYQKHNPQQQQSYRLDFIGEIEVGENKVAYEGTLDDLYNKDFFKFIEYSRQDVMLMVKIDQKKQFIELANQIAHVNSVLLKTTMGSVTLVEQAIINEMHDMGLVVPCRKAEKEDEFVHVDDDDDDDEFDGKGPVVGAYVAKPKVGIASHVGCVDINSLYPSAIRALNISPETVVGQVRQTETKAEVSRRIASGIKRAEAWDGLFATIEFSQMTERSGAPVTIDFDDGTTKEMSARQLHEYIFDPKNKLCITANGTIFRTDKAGIIPQLLAKWYAERKSMQGMKKIFGSISGGGLEISAELASAVSDIMENDLTQGGLTTPSE